MSNYTKCRWIAVGGWVEVEDDNIPDICTCDPEDMGQDYLERSEQEIMANARLIAAAPDLLLALKSLLDAQRDASLPVLKLARAAIAKAEGV